jgi:DNA polymerase III epsilon subunit-like protein
METLLFVPQNADLASQPLVTAPPFPSETQKAQRWVIVDTETDGLTAPIHVVEIAAQLMEGWKTCGDPFQVFLNHNVHIPRSAVAIHGYTQEFLRANGRPPMEAHEAFRQYAGEFPIVAHSLAYDWNRALVPEWSRLGLKPAGCRGFCTVTLSRRVLPEADSYSLDELKSRFGLGSGPSHKAKADVETVVRLFTEILRPRLESAGLTTFEAWQQFAQRTPVADCWCLIDPSRKPQSHHRVRQVPVLKSKCYRCFGGIEFSENGIGHRIKCPHCGQITKLGLNPFATPLSTTVEIRFSKCEPAPAGIPPPLPERKRTEVDPILRTGKRRN